jgi:peptide-methionine (S)-S-oxide reductase
MSIGKWIRALSLASGGAAALAVGAAAQPAAPHASAGRSANEAFVVLSGGCFWGMQSVFEHVRGVTSVVAGYAGGDAGTAMYEAVSTGATGHAESVRVAFDTTQISFAQILQVFFTVHDPTQLNRQGPDDGSQYRSVIWYTSDTQKRAAKDYIGQLAKAKAYPQPIVTEVAPFRGFYAAEAYHQDYAEHHPLAPYIVINDRPKVERLRTLLPQLYRADPLLTTASGGTS